MRAGIFHIDIPNYLFSKVCNKADFSSLYIDIHNNCSNVCMFISSGVQNRRSILHANTHSNDLNQHFGSMCAVHSSRRRHIPWLSIWTIVVNIYVSQISAIFQPYFSQISATFQLYFSHNLARFQPDFS